MKSQYSHIYGTGGIGSGLIFELEGDHTLGRNESRIGTLFPAKDFCKQHIILHYVSIFISELSLPIEVYPIGMVGHDTVGVDLLRMIDDTGMNTSFVQRHHEEPTLFSVCYQYPDSSAGNITTGNSASSMVSPEYVKDVLKRNQVPKGKGIAVAAPEVPIESRIALLKHGRENDYFNAASILSAEIDEWEKLGGFELVDLLAINGDEANHLAGTSDKPVKEILDTCLKRLNAGNPKMSTLITDGSRASYLCTTSGVEKIEPFSVDVKSSAGGGNALLSGTLAGLCLGMELGRVEGKDMSAVDLGMAIAALSVTSLDTIYLEFGLQSLLNFLDNERPTWANELRNVLDQASSVMEMD